MPEEEQSAVSEQMDLIQKMHISAYADAFQTFGSLCQYLKLRQEYARRYIDTGSEIQKEDSIKGVEYCNEQIKQILGL